MKNENGAGQTALESTSDTVLDQPEKGKKKSPKKPLFDQSIVDRVPVTLDAFLGDANLTVSELMDLENGSIVTLNANLNHRAELRLNGDIVGYGEIVAVGNKFGIRITEIGD